MSDEEALAACENLYRLDGYLILGYFTPHSVGDVVTPADDFLHHAKWKVTADSNLGEYISFWKRSGYPVLNTDAHLYYRVEAMD